MAQQVKNPPAMQEPRVQSLGWEDALEKETAPTPIFLPGEFHRLYSPWGHKESDTTEQLSLSDTSYKLESYSVFFFLDWLISCRDRLFFLVCFALICFTHEETNV